MDSSTGSFGVVSPLLVAGEGGPGDPDQVSELLLGKAGLSAGQACYEQALVQGEPSLGVVIRSVHVGHCATNAQGCALGIYTYFRSSHYQPHTDLSSNSQTRPACVSPLRKPVRGV